MCIRDSTYPGIPLRPGDRSQDVRHMQGRLNEVARIYTGINTQTVDCLLYTSRWV